MADAADDGACPLHPAIQLRRRQRRTGEWKAILKACPLCASGLPASEGAAANSDGGAATNMKRDAGTNNEGRSRDGSEDDDRSVRSSLGHSPRHTRSSSGRRAGRDAGNIDERRTRDVSEEDDARSVHSSLSHTSHRSSSGRRAGGRCGSRSQGSSSSGRAGSSGRASSRGHERASSRSGSSRASSRGHERSSSRSGSRSRGHEHPSRHSGNDLDYDERSVSSRASRVSHRSASRTDVTEEDRSVATMDNSEALSHVSSSVSSLSTRPMSNKGAESSSAGVRFHPATKPPDERSVISGADGNESESDDSDSEESENSLGAASSSESDRNLETIAHIESAIHVATNARREAEQGLRPGVSVPTKGGNEDGRDFANGIGNYERRYSEECATDDEDGSCSSLEEGSRTSSFGDNKRPLPPRGVLRQSSYGPPAAEGRANAEAAMVVHSENDEAMVVYEELDEPRAYPERMDGGGSAQQEMYPPPPRNAPAQNSRWTPEQFRGKMYEGAPVEAPVEDNECGAQGARQLTPEQERSRPPPRDQHCYQEPGYQEQGYHKQGYHEQGYHEQGYREQGYPDQSYPQEQAHPPRPREDERSVHSQPRQRRSSSRSRGRDDEDQRSVRSLGRGRSAQPGSHNGRSRSQSRTRDRRDSITSQPQKPVGILRQGKHGNPQRRPQEPPSPEGISPNAPPHMEQRCAEAPERMQGNRGPPPPYGNNAIPQAPRLGPPAFLSHHLQGGPREQSTGEHGREMSAPKKPGKGSSQDGRGNDASQTEPETDFGESHSSNRRGQADRPSEFDDRGRCVLHPHIKLRKKKLLGGWKVLLVNCPDCCIEEMLRMKRDARGASGGRGKAKGARKPKRRSNNDEGSASHGSNQSPPIAQLTIRTHEADTSDVESTGSSASEITFTSGQQSRSSELGSGGSGPHRVTRMPFTDAYGDKGWYTGEVASGSGLPHGRGTMHYCDGRTREGWWSNGLAGGGGGPDGPRNGNRGPPPTHLPPRGDGSVHSRSSGHHHLGPPPPQSQQFSPPSHHHNNLPPPPQQHLAQTNGAVHDMEWTDLRGRFGFYTGETDASGEPHGLGSVRYEDEAGAVEGEWFHGELERRIEGLAVRPAGR